MKRVLGGNSLAELTGDSVRYCKRSRIRERRQVSPSSSDCIFQCDESSTPPLTRETLKNLDATTQSETMESYVADYVQSIWRWADG